MADYNLNAHARPPESLRVFFKKWQKQIDFDADLLEPVSFESDDRVKSCVPSCEQVKAVHNAFQNFTHRVDLPLPRLQAFELKSLPGLIVLPSLLPYSVQTSLLDKLMHRDLHDARHKTNLDLHYHMHTCASPLFHCEKGLQLQPKDTTVHKPITIKQVLDRKLRWVTLGGQYDWTRKVYPNEQPPPFPSDIAGLIRSAFPDIEPQAAILNFYSPGDTLSLHRDVSEECDRDLVSISIGCDALFLVANTDGSQSAVIRLRSGDALLMSGPSRFAWHAVPKVIPHTCPSELRKWPGGAWDGWLGTKRINLNVRQMRETLSAA